MGSSIQELVNSKASSEKIHEEAVKKGMTTLLEDGLDKVQRGLTSLEEILRATKN